MSKLVPIAGAELPRRPHLGDLPNDVHFAVAHYISPDPYAGDRVRRLPSAMRERCREMVAAAEALMEPASVDLVFVWLKMVSTAFAWTPSEADLRMLATPVALICTDLPAFAFSRDSVIAAMGAWKNRPSAMDVKNLVAEGIADFLAKIRALKALGEEPPHVPLDPPRPPKTAEDFAYARARVVEAIAELAEITRVREAQEYAARAGRGKIQLGRPIRPEHLAAARQAAGIAQACHLPIVTDGNAMARGPLPSVSLSAPDPEAVKE